MEPRAFDPTAVRVKAQSDPRAVDPGYASHCRRTVIRQSVQRGEQPGTVPPLVIRARARKLCRAENPHQNWRWLGRPLSAHGKTQAGARRDYSRVKKRRRFDLFSRRCGASS